MDVIPSLLRADPKDQPLHVEVSLFKSILAYWQGEWSHSLRYIREALDQIPTSLTMIRGLKYGRFVRRM